MKPYMLAGNVLLLLFIAFVQFWLLPNTSCAVPPSFASNPVSYLICFYEDAVQWGVYVFALAGVIGLILSLVTSDTRVYREERYIVHREEKTSTSKTEETSSKSDLGAPQAPPTAPEAPGALDSQSPPSTIPQYCPQCGAKNPPQVKFCHKCGAQL